MENSVEVFKDNNGNILKREWIYEKANRQKSIIEIGYAEWYENNNSLVGSKVEKVFFIQNCLEGKTIKHSFEKTSETVSVNLPNTKEPFKQEVEVVKPIAEEAVLYPEFKGFDKWYKMDLGVIENGELGELISISIDSILKTLPANTQSGYTYNPRKLEYEATL